MNKRQTLRKLVALSVLSALPVAARAAGELKEGVDYVRIPTPQPPSKSGVEVVEFFSYACPHCNEAEPIVAKWRTTLPKDVTFRRVPISFGRSSWEAVAKLYLALEQSGDLEKLHRAVFTAIHQEKAPLATEQAVIDWAAKRVSDPKKFAEIYRSFGVQAALRNSEQLGATFGISGVPSFGVGGRYLVVAKDAKSFEGVLDVASRVVELARKTASAK